MKIIDKLVFWFANVWRVICLPLLFTNYDSHHRKGRGYYASNAPINNQRQHCCGYDIMLCNKILRLHSLYFSVTDLFSYFVIGHKWISRNNWPIKQISQVSVLSAERTASKNHWRWIYPIHVFRSVLYIIKDRLKIGIAEMQVLWVFELRCCLTI